MFADDGAEASLDARWGMKFGPVDRFHVSFSPGWSHRSTAYAEPYSYRVLNRVVLSGGVAGTITVARLWMLDGAAGFKSDIPFRCSLNMHPRDGELRSLEVIERDAFSLESHRSASVSASIGVTRSIGPRYAVGLSGDWSHLTAYNNMKQNNYNLKISFIF